MPHQICRCIFSEISFFWKKAITQLTKFIFAEKFYIKTEKSRKTMFVYSKFKRGILFEIKFSLI